MKVETYRFNWKTFEEELPKKNSVFLVRKAKETIKDARWAFRTSNDKEFFIGRLSNFAYLSQCKKWLWCYDYEIERIEE